MDKSSKTLAEARAKKWEGMKRKSTLRIPPDTDSHNLKVTRANYQAFIMLNFMNPDAPSSPLQHGWSLREDKCLPIRYSQPALPQRLIYARKTALQNLTQIQILVIVTVILTLHLMDMTLSRMMNCAIKQDKHHWTMCLEICCVIVGQ